MRDPRARADAVDPGDHRRPRSGASSRTERRLSPILILAVGNPSRGDDRIGPLALDVLERRLAEPISRGEVELLGDFQLQVELVFDLMGREGVVFVDASVTAEAPFEWGPVVPETAPPTTSHALSPGALLGCYQRLFGAPPPAWVMAVRGEQFELGEGLSEAAEANLERAVEKLVAEVLVLIEKKRA